MAKVRHWFNSNEYSQPIQLPDGLDYKFGEEFTMGKLNKCIKMEEYFRGHQSFLSAQKSPIFKTRTKLQTKMQNKFFQLF